MVPHCRRWTSPMDIVCQIQKNNMSSKTSVGIFVLQKAVSVYQHVWKSPRSQSDHAIRRGFSSQEAQMSANWKASSSSAVFDTHYIRRVTFAQTFQNTAVPFVHSLGWLLHDPSEPIIPRELRHTISFVWHVSNTVYEIALATRFHEKIILTYRTCTQHHNSRLHDMPVTASHYALEVA